MMEHPSWFGYVGGVQTITCPIIPREQYPRCRPHLLNLCIVWSSKVSIVYDAVHVVVVNEDGDTTRRGFEASITKRSFIIAAETLQHTLKYTHRLFICRTSQLWPESNWGVKGRQSMHLHVIIRAQRWGCLEWTVREDCRDPYPYTYPSWAILQLYWRRTLCIIPLMPANITRYNPRGASLV